MDEEIRRQRIVQLKLVISASKLTHSSHSDTQKDSDTNTISFQSREIRRDRRFFINRKYEGCGGLNGLMMIGDQDWDWEKQKVQDSYTVSNQETSTT